MTLLFQSESRGGVGKGGCVVLCCAGVSWENEVIEDVVQQRGGFTAQPGVQPRSLAWAFWFLLMEQLRAHPHFPEEPHQVLALEDSVIWFLDIFHQRVIQTCFLKGSFPSQASSGSISQQPRLSSGCRGISEGWADVRGEGCASVPMETIWRVFQLV